MNTASVRRSLPRIPLPKGPEHQAWVVDMIDPVLFNKEWGPATAPHDYSPAGVWVRMAMPWNGVRRADLLLKRLADYAHREQGRMHQQFGAPRDWPNEDLAKAILGLAVNEPNANFMIINIAPSGRSVFFHRLRATGSWHPDSPERGEQ